MTYVSFIVIPRIVDCLRLKIHKRALVCAFRTIESSTIVYAQQDAACIPFGLHNYCLVQGRFPDIISNVMLFLFLVTAFCGGRLDQGSCWTWRALDS